MRAEVTSPVDSYPHVMFSTARAWILSGLTETCRHVRPGSVINLNPSSCFDVCLSAGTDHVWSLLNITSAALGQTSSCQKQPRIPYSFCCSVRLREGEGFIDHFSWARFDQFCFPIWYSLGTTAWPKAIRTEGIPWCSLRGNHSRQRQVASMLWVPRWTDMLRTSSLLQLNLCHTTWCSLFCPYSTNAGL